MKINNNSTGSSSNRNDEKKTKKTAVTRVPTRTTADDTHIRRAKHVPQVFDLIQGPKLGGNLNKRRRHVIDQPARSEQTKAQQSSVPSRSVTRSAKKEGFKVSSRLGHKQLMKQTIGAPTERTTAAAIVHSQLPAVTSCS